MGCSPLNSDGTRNALCVALPEPPRTPEEDIDFTPDPLPWNADGPSLSSADQPLREQRRAVLDMPRDFANRMDHLVLNAADTALEVPASALSHVLNPFRNAAAGALGQPMPEQLTTDRAKHFADNMSHASTAMVTGPAKWVADGVANAVHTGLSIVHGAMQYGATAGFVGSGGVVNGGFPAYTPQHALEAPPEWHMPTGSDLLKMTPPYMAIHLAESCGRPMAPGDTACDDVLSGVMGAVAGLPRSQTTADFHASIKEWKQIKSAIEDALVTPGAPGLESIQSLVSSLKNAEREIGHASSGLKAAEMREQALALRSEAKRSLEALQSHSDPGMSTEGLRLIERKVVVAQAHELQAAHLELNAAKESLASLRRRCDEAINAFEDPFFTGKKLPFTEIAEMSSAIKRGEDLLAQSEVHISEDVLQAPGPSAQKMQVALRREEEGLARVRREYAREPDFEVKLWRRNAMDVYGNAVKRNEGYLRLARLEDEMASLAQKRTRFESPAVGIRDGLSHTEQAELASLDVEIARVEAQYRYESLQMRHGELVDSHQIADYGYRTGETIGTFTSTAVDYARQNVELAAKWLKDIGKTW